MKRSAILRKTRLRSVSKKRAKALREYSERRKAFLAAHPFCQVFLQTHGMDEAHVINGWPCQKQHIAGFMIIPPQRENSDSLYENPRHPQSHRRDRRPIED